MIKRLKKIAEVFKPNKFHYALLDYLTDELRSNSIHCRKQSSYIKIKLEKLVEEKFDHVIIDCFNGGIYLRGEGVKDKKILKLNRFYGDRESDAMNCACGGSKQIMRYLESLNTSDELIVESKKKVDMRKITNLIDMKIKNKLKKIADLNGRDFAIAIINGEIFSGDTHGEAITKYLQQNDINDISVYDRHELENIMGYGFKNQFAAAHAKDDIIYLEPETLENITLEQAANLISHNYPGYKIINVDTDERIANLKNKKMARDINDRDIDGAIVYIDGNIYTAKTHGQAISNYLIQNYNQKLNDNYFRPFLYNKNCDPMGDVADEDLEDVQMIADNINQLAFAHKNSDYNTIYIERDTLQNVDINTVTEIIKNTFPDYTICLDETNEKVAKKIIDLRLIKINRLRKLARDRDERDYNNGAIVYINGEIVEGNTHGEAIANYLFFKANCIINDNYYRPAIYDSNYDPKDEISDEDKEDIENIKKNIKQIAFAHKNSDDNTIYIERDTLQNIDLNTVTNTIKKEYPDFDICLDETNQKVAKKIMDLRVIKISRLKKNAMDVSDRDYDGALIYINGEIIVANTHAQAINKYLQKHSDTTLIEDWFRPYYFNQNQNYIQNYNPNNVDLKDKQTIDDNIKQLAFAHIVSDEENVISDNKNMIYIEKDTLQNVDINTVVSAIKKEYPNYDIAIEETCEKVAKRIDMRKLKQSRLKKLSGFHDKNNRTSAIMYLDGEVLEGADHYDMITQYMKEKYNLDRTNLEQERETDELFDSLSYAMGSKVDEDKTIYIDDDTLNNIDEQTIINAIKIKYPDFNVEIETSSNEDMQEYMGGTFEELWKKYQENEFKTA